ncbi:hypothetical protein [Streptomyces antibioticus]|uniref:hypothetical protein n=1 Tax=Streptomyces antibioticus TaxID=1890 RepID=UPI0037007000
MTFRYRLLVAAHTLAVLGIAVAAVVAANFLPIPDPNTAWAVDTAAGLFAGLGASTWLPCPCHRKDHR